MSALIELAERVEALTVPDREVDALMQRALGDGSRYHWFADMNGAWVTDANAPRYTASLDAAMTLVPEGAYWAVKHYPNAKCAADVFGTRQGYAATPAVALCAAALRARATLNPGENG